MQPKKFAAGALIPKTAHNVIVVNPASQSDPAMREPAANWK